jgi:nucleoside-diphosphate-sugar epimerase
VGKNLVRELSKNEEVRILVHKDMAKIENVEVVYGDLLNKESLEKALKDVDTIYHLAAVVDYLAPKDVLFKVNVLGTKNLVELAGNRKIIYLSTTAVMGRKLKEMPANENTTTNPSNYYGWTKLQAEEMVRKNRGIIIRSAQIFGPGFSEEYNLIISRLEQGKLPIIGDGKNFLHWIHINDLLQALLLAKDRGKLGETYLVAGKEVKTLKDLLNLLCKYLEIDPPKKQVSKFMAKTGAYYNVLKWKVGGKKPKLIPEYIEKMTANRTFDISKAKEVLGFDPQVSYDEAAREMVEEYKKLKAEEQEDKVTEEQSEDNA